MSVRATTFVGGLPRDADGVGRGREAVGERKNRQSEANHSIERTIPNPVLGDGATCECLEAPRAPFLGKSGHNVVRMNSLHPRDEALVYRLLPPRLGEYTGGGPLRIFFFFSGLADELQSARQRGSTDSASARAEFLGHPRQLEAFFVRESRDSDILTLHLTRQVKITNRSFVSKPSVQNRRIRCFHIPRKRHY